MSEPKAGGRSWLREAHVAAGAGGGWGRGCCAHMEGSEPGLLPVPSSLSWEVGGLLGWGGAGRGEGGGQPHPISLRQNPQHSHGRLPIGSTRCRPQI